jgi:ATP-binding cassette subfamily F protein 3
VLLVSHDRALIEALATRTIAIEDGRLRLRDGAFGEYARDHEPAVERPKPAEKPKANKPPPARSSQRQAREAARLEQQIQTLEEELGGIEARLSQPEAYADPDALSEDGLRHRSLQEELAHLYREWEIRAG